MGQYSCEAIVIGSGPGGAVATRVLAEAGLDVLVLEEGRRHRTSHKPPFSPFSLDEMIEAYRSQGLTASLGRPKISFAEAKILGGGSEINSGIYLRTPNKILDEWTEKFGLKRCRPQDLYTHFAAIEKDLEMNRAEKCNLISWRLKRAGECLGWKGEFAPMMIREGVRQSMSRTYLERAVDAGARIHPESRAIRIKRRRDHWEVHVLRGKKFLKYRSQSVFLAAGTLQSALILRRSGIQKKKSLFALHPMIKILAEFEEPINDGRAQVGSYQSKEFAPEMSFGCSLSTLPYIALSLVGRRELGDSLVKTSRWKNCGIYYCMIRPEGRGSIHRFPFLNDPIVKYQLTDGDVSALSLGLKRLGRALLSAGARRIVVGSLEIPPITSERELNLIPDQLDRSHLQLSSLHLFSSLPMGEVLSSFGELEGVGSTPLIVSDASILPSSPGVNPQGTIMAFSRRNTMRFLEERR